MPGRFRHLEFNEEDRRWAPVQAASAEQTHSAEAYCRSAREAEEYDNYELSLRLFTRALREDRAMIPAWVGQVRMLVYLEEYHEARLWADKALELFRNHGDLLAAKAQACMRLHDRSAAMAGSDGSLRAAGSSAWRWQARGDVLLGAGHGPHAECFEKALNEPAADWFDRIIIARILLYHQRPAQAVRYAMQAKDLRPDHAGVWYALGQCQFHLGLTEQALRSYQRCLHIQPKYPPATQALKALEHRSWLGQGWRRVKGWFR